jgi:hypothetical protein
MPAEHRRLEGDPPADGGRQAGAPASLAVADVAVSKSMPALRTASIRSISGRSNSRLDAKSDG